MHLTVLSGPASDGHDVAAACGSLQPSASAGCQGSSRIAPGAGPEKCKQLASYCAPARKKLIREVGNFDMCDKVHIGRDCASDNVCIARPVMTDLVALHCCLRPQSARQFVTQQRLNLICRTASCRASARVRQVQVPEKGGRVACARSLSFLVWASHWEGICHATPAP